MYHTNDLEHYNVYGFPGVLRSIKCIAIHSRRFSLSTHGKVYLMEEEKRVYVDGLEVIRRHCVI